MSLPVPPGPVAVLQIVTFALGTEEAAVLLPGWEVPDGNGESLSLPGSWQGESKARDLRLWERGDGAVLWSKCSSVCSQQVDVFSVCVVFTAAACSSRCWNTPEISMGLLRTGICEGTELPPRSSLSLLSLQ